MKRLTWRRLACAITLLFVLVYFALPREAYERYVTEPLDSLGMRAEFLIPKGWRSTQPANWLPIGPVGLHPPDSPGWWPSFLRKIFPPSDANLNFLEFSCAPTKTEFADTPAETDGEYPFGNHSFFLVTRMLKSSHGLTVVLAYARDSHSKLESTKAVILRSFKLLPGGS